MWWVDQKMMRERLNEFKCIFFIDETMTNVRLSGNKIKCSQFQTFNRRIFLLRSRSSLIHLLLYDNHDDDDDDDHDDIRRPTNIQFQFLLFKVVAQNIFFYFWNIQVQYKLNQIFFNFYL